MPKERRCPNCGAVLPVGNGVNFDDTNSVICGQCGKPIVPATSESEEEVKAKNAPKAPTKGIGFNPGCGHPDIGCFLRAPKNNIGIDTFPEIH